MKKNANQGEAELCNSQGESPLAKKKKRWISLIGKK